MTILKKPDFNGKRQIDLTGPNGNAFYLLGVAEDCAQLLGLNWIKLREEMVSGDYENLINVFDREFGSFIDLIR